MNLTLSNTSHYTEKVPDFILLKESRKEVMKLEAQISKLYETLEKRQEQIDYLNQMVNGLTVGENRQVELEVRRNVKKEELYKMQREERKRINLSIKKYKLSNERLICENIQLKMKLNSL